ncbi:MAG: Beta-1,4-mannooligosaccharide phosphorylase [bacterium ADurb.Bin236]|nr:MAG: Beta-1,4-mannooligosaccharide phosphorylase [bacterium ADurb.Bin236]
MGKSQFTELFHRHHGNPILTANDLTYPANTVFNAGAAKVDGDILLLIRVEDKRGISHLTAARSCDGIHNWRIDPEPTLPPSPDTHPEEIWGIEDPRLTYLEEKDVWAVTYTAYSKGGPLVSLALTKDFRTFERQGPVMPPEDKDAALFPRRFDGRWAMIHRPVPHITGAGAHIWISYSPDLKHWGDHRMLIPARRGGWWDANKIGLSPPPIETQDGWLILYHGVRVTGSGVIYRLGLALLDLNNPGRLIARSDEWVFGPSEGYELFGDVDKVVFPCGWIRDSDKILLYYGGADSCIALATASLSEMLSWLREHNNMAEE